jgi:hypothetical protein
MLQMRANLTYAYSITPMQGLAQGISPAELSHTMVKCLAAQTHPKTSKSPNSSRIMSNNVNCSHGS